MSEYFMSAGKSQFKNSVLASGQKTKPPSEYFKSAEKSQFKNSVLASGQNTEPPSEICQEKKSASNMKDFESGKSYPDE